MKNSIKTFVNNSRLVRTRNEFGYIYTWRFEDHLGQTMEMDIEDFCIYISDNLAKLRVKNFS